MDPIRIQIAMTHPAPAKDTDRFFEAIEAGEVFEVEDARTITEADIVNFAGVSGDFHRHHVSKAFAEKDSNFEGRVAHGNLTFVVTEGVIAEMNPKALSYGHNVRYHRPVKIGDTLSVKRTVTETEDYDDTYGRVVYEYETRNQDGDVVLVDEHIMLIRKEGTESKRL